MANTAAEGKKKQEKKPGCVSPTSSAMLWLHQIACIFGIHGVFSTDLRPQIRLDSLGLEFRMDT